MDGTGPQLPLGDSQLDRDIESALSIEPSPEFLARARARIAAEPEPSPWRLAHVVAALSPTRRWTVQPVAVMALVGVVLAIVVPRVMRDQRAGPLLNASRPVEAGLQAGLSAGTANDAVASRQASPSRLPIR
jgi:hypothetical protein